MSVMFPSLPNSYHWCKALKHCKKKKKKSLILWKYIVKYMQVNMKYQNVNTWPGLSTKSIKQFLHFYGPNLSSKVYIFCIRRKYYWSTICSSGFFLSPSTPPTSSSSHHYSSLVIRGHNDSAFSDKGLCNQGAEEGLHMQEQSVQASQHLSLTFPVFP